MKTAARERVWTAQDFNRIRAILQEIPGQAWMSWNEVAENSEPELRAWANSFGEAVLASGKSETEQVELDLQAVLGKPGRRGGIAPGLTAAQRKAVETRAMAVVWTALEDEGWKVVDKSSGNPFDLLATRDGIEIHVEVKGTTTAGERVILTKGEVNHHRDAQVESALYVISMIELAGTKEVPEAKGGVLRAFYPWRIAEGDLTPLAFEYSVPMGGVGPGSV